MQVGDALADPVVDPDEDAVGAETLLEGVADALRGAEQGCQQLGGKVHERDDVLAGDEQHMAGKDRPRIEKPDDVGLVKDDMRRQLSTDDLAEQASVHDR